MSETAARHEQLPLALRPYLAFGVDVKWAPGQVEAVGECPFCGKLGKFSVNSTNGLWCCRIPGCVATPRGGGNLQVFMEELWRRSVQGTGEGHAALAYERRLLYPATLRAWGVCQSYLTGEWLVPGYRADGGLRCLYRYATLYGKGTKRVLKAVAGVSHGLFGVPLLHKGAERVWVCEGPWDGMALWEALRTTKRLGDLYTVTANPSSALAATAGVLAVPGCNVWHEEWSTLLAGKKVGLLYDNDHPVKGRDGKDAPAAGTAGMQRLAGLLLANGAPPAALTYLHWGAGGHDPKRPSGYDVRDWLAAAGAPRERAKALGQIMASQAPIPKEWLTQQAAHKARELGTLPCQSWPELLLCWRKALHWGPTLEEVLAVMLAVALSTQQMGNDQLFLQVIGEAGTAKTRLCDALLTSRTCHPLEHLTGFHSGCRDQEGSDYSLLARINGKTLITPEGDVLLANPRFQEIMSQQRRIFDGTSGATYKNRKEDLRYAGLRTPWIVAGTPAFLCADQSHLGDRFLRVCMDPPEGDDRRAILRRVAYTSMRSVRQTANCSPDSVVEEHLLAAYRRTGGYVDWLRSNATHLLARVAVQDEEALVNTYADYAEFTALFRAREAIPRKGQEEAQDAVELPTRLTAQYARLALCLAVVLNRWTVDEEVLRRLRKVARDTAAGRSYRLAVLLASRPGLSVRELSREQHTGEERLQKLLNFLRRTGALESWQEVLAGSGGRGPIRYRLTARVAALYDRLHGAPTGRGVVR